MTLPLVLQTLNHNQQTNFDYGVAVANVEYSNGLGKEFDPANHRLDTSKPVIIVGGGSAEEFDTVVEKHGGLDSVYVIAAGSAAFRLNREVQEQSGHPFLECADAVVLNGVDDGTQADYYQRIAGAVALHEGVEVYLASYNGAEAFNALPNAVRVPARLEGDVSKDNWGLGSTAPTAALIIAMAQGFKRFEFVGVKGADVTPVPEGQSYDELRGAFDRVRAYVAKRQRYPDFEMPPELQSIPEGNKVLVYAGVRDRAEIPSGQFYTLQELRRLVDWGQSQGMTFTFSGEQSLTHLMLEKGVPVHVAYDARGVISSGTTLEGLNTQDFIGEMPEAKK